MRAFPKIFALGHAMIPDILVGEVQISEKMDGSQFGFGKTPEGKLRIRSKGQWIEPDNPPELFANSVAHVLSVQYLINPDTMYYGEAITRPKHNTLRYDNVPKGHIVLFAAGDWAFHEVVTEQPALRAIADTLGMDVAPLLYKGTATPKTIQDMLERESFLGGPNIEGVVVKRFVPWEYFGQYYPVQCGKLVSEAFKEKHSKNTEFMSGKSKFQMFLEQYNTEGRWRKAIQHLRENGELEGSPRDIGPLLAEINRDFDDECKQEVMEALWKAHKKEVYRTIQKGFPMFYKTMLLESLNERD